MSIYLPASPDPVDGERNLLLAKSLFDRVIAQFRGQNDAGTETAVEE
ncbi:hypothetical protein [Arthrobacter alpinus]|nr:hypothetical protein [Arthrobacter alpinus]